MKGLNYKEADKAITNGKIISIFWNGTNRSWYKTIYFLDNGRLCYIDVIKDKYENMTQSKIHNSAYESISNLVTIIPKNDKASLTIENQ